MENSLELKEKIKNIFLDYMDDDQSGKSIKYDAWDELANELVKLFINQLKTTYYALWDLQTNKRMATGLNCQSLDDVKYELWCYFEPDRVEIFLTDDIDEVTLDLLLEVGEFVLEKSDKPFVYIN